jgi:hypothetical protein
MASDPILGAILSAFIESTQRDSFNGASSLRPSFALRTTPIGFGRT